MEVIKVEKLSKSYQGVKVLDSLSFKVSKGEVLGLLGANGAGKSTAIECILGTRKKDSGDVKILNMDPIKQRKKLFQTVGVQFQDSSYQREIRVDELCQETAAIYKNPIDWRVLLEKFGIKDKEKSAVKDLSGGQRQKLFIILALILQPEIVFLDELTTGLDARARHDVWQILKSLKEQGMTIILTSHFMDEIEILCDYIIILKKGKTVYQGTIKDAIVNSPYEKFEDVYLYYSEQEESLSDENI